MIGIIHVGSGNVGSVRNACTFLKVPSKIITNPDQMADCDIIILPGQGHFGDFAHNFIQKGFLAPLTHWIESGRPLLGICVGMQFLCEGSEEAPSVKGMGIFPGQLKRFNVYEGHKVPQMGWNTVTFHPEKDPLLKNIPPNPYFYFVHSYYLPCPKNHTSFGCSTYGITYTSVLKNKHVLATQFHPEKSQKYGLQLMKNFLQEHLVQAT